jgi:DNA-binding NarL/FixJ family response regulator
MSIAMRAAPHRRSVDAVTAGRRVVIAEDSVLLLAGLTKLLESAGFEVAATAADAAGLLAAVEREQPDVVIADVRMPPTHTDEGIKAALVIRSQWPDIAVLVLSQYVEERYAADLLSANTHGIGYLLKDRVADVAEFLDALRRVAAGGTALDPEVVAQLLVRRGGDPLDDLTDRERDVLALMAEGRSNAEIAATLVITDSAVSKHINSIFAKLGLYPHDAGHRRVLAVLRYLGVDPALCRGRGERGLLRLDEGFGAQPGLIGLLPAADAEQPLAPDQVDDEQQVDHQRPGPQPGDLHGQVVDLVRQEDRGRHHGEVFAPPLAQPQPARPDHRPGVQEINGAPRLVHRPDPARDDGGRNGVRVPRTAGRVAGRAGRRHNRARPRGARNRRGHRDQARGGLTGVSGCRVSGCSVSGSGVSGCRASGYGGPSPWWSSRRVR